MIFPQAIDWSEGAHTGGLIGGEPCRRILVVEEVREGCFGPVGVAGGDGEIEGGCSEAELGCIFCDGGGGGRD